jgi:hypothetical protein
MASGSWSLCPKICVAGITRYTVYSILVPNKFGREIHFLIFSAMLPNITGYSRDTDGYIKVLKMAPTETDHHLNHLNLQQWTVDNISPYVFLMVFTFETSHMSVNWPFWADCGKTSSSQLYESITTAFLISVNIVSSLELRSLYLWWLWTRMTCTVQHSK